MLHVNEVVRNLNEQSSSPILLVISKDVSHYTDNFKCIKRTYSNAMLTYYVS